ncbi:MAG: hypothetical protein H6627_09015 [Calditrichae bacterium]|nr:hypothetical protein [Calditrichota bacterium]MCB9058694.1 hypothetical protein [Calditrichia bacterium]
MAKLLDTLFKGFTIREIEEILFIDMDKHVKMAAIQPIQSVSAKKYVPVKRESVAQKIYKK